MSALTREHTEMIERLRPATVGKDVSRHSKSLGTSRGKLRGRLEMCNPFLRGFLPGILIGLFTSLLLLSLWRHPSAEVHVDVAAVSSVKREGSRPRPQENTETEQHSPSPTEADMVTRIKKLTDSSAAAIPGAYVVLVLVHSSAGQRSLRDAVRETWLRQRSQPNAYVARFVLGTHGLGENSLASLVAENEEHKDLLVLPEIEEDSRAEWPSSRKLLASFSWAVSHVNFSSVFKCNSATFALLDKIVSTTQQHNSHLWGYFAGGVKAVRHSSASVLAEEDWILCSHYLPYPEGGGYVISRELVELIVDMGPDLKHYRHDDIALGTWISAFKGIKKQHSVGFNSGHYSRGCMNSYLVSHRETAQSMRDKYSNLQNKGILCQHEHQSRLSYRYNWTSPASHCCIRKAGIP